MSFFEEHFPKDHYDDNDEDIEVNECSCDECHAIFYLPSDAEPDTCPVCGCSFNC